MRVIFFLCTVLAVARAFHDPRDAAFRLMMETIDDATELTSKLFGDSRRTPNAACSQLKGMTAATVSSALQSEKKVPSTCTDPMANFVVNVMCSTACQASNIFSGSRRGERVLLGGSTSSFSPSTTCADPCFTLTIGSSGYPALLPAMTNTQCAPMMQGSSRRAATRNLLGGSSTTTAMTAMVTMFQVLCSKNSQGNYCMALIPTLKLNQSATINYTAWNIPSSAPSSALPITILSQNCIYDNSSVSQLQSLGCCYGSMQQIATIAMTSQSDIDSFQTGMSVMTAAAAGCGVTLSSVPCTASGMPTTYVTSTVGISVPNCSSVTPVVSLGVAKAIAATANVSSANVQITGLTCQSRRGSATATFQSQTQVPVSADAATISNNLQNTAVLTTNLQTQTAGTPLAGQVAVTTNSVSVTTTGTGGGGRTVASFLAMTLLSAIVMKL